MHELGVVFHIMDRLEEVAADNGAKKISRVVIDLGEVSTVIPHYLTDCWNWAASKSELFGGSELKVVTIPAVTFCDSCERKYETVRYGRTCPYCGSEETWLLQGNEFVIREIEIRGDDALSDGDMEDKVG